MKAIQPLLPALSPGEQDLNCIRCGLCLAVCPTYRELLSETASPRGRATLARKGLEGEMEISPNLVEQMYACFDCLACNEICPAGIRPADLAMEMRALQELRRPSAWKKIVFGSVVSRPGRMEASTLALRLYERSGLRRLAHALGLVKWLPGRAHDMEAMLPRLPQRPLRQTLPEVTPAAGGTKYRVGFFLGCAQSLLFAGESAAGVRVLARNGCEVVTPRKAVCCGMPALAYGRVEEARRQARDNIAIYEQAGVEFVITDCATCGSTLKDYGRLLAGDPAWAGRAAAFSARARDISEFLAGIPLEKPRHRLEGRVTYHDPCHLRRGQDVWKQPRALLSMIDGLEFVELPEADRCCGLAGTQIITHYETSIGVLKRKAERLVSTQADWVASGCPACQMQLKLGLRRAASTMEVTHPIVLLERAYRDGEER